MQALNLLKNQNFKKAEDAMVSLGFMPLVYSMSHFFVIKWRLVIVIKCTYNVDYV